MDQQHHRKRSSNKQIMASKQQLAQYQKLKRYKTARIGKFGTRLKDVEKYIQKVNAKLQQRTGKKFAKKTFFGKKIDVAVICLELYKAKMNGVLIEKLRELLKKDCKKMQLKNKLHQDRLFNKTYFEKKENRVAFYNNQSKVQTGTKTTRFFDSVERTFSHQKAFSLNVKNMLLNITDNNELQLQAIKEIKQFRRKELEEQARKIVIEDELTSKGEIWRKQVHNVQTNQKIVRQFSSEVHKNPAQRIQEQKQSGLYYKNKMRKLQNKINKNERQKSMKRRQLSQSSAMLRESMIMKKKQKERNRVLDYLEKETSKRMKQHFLNERNPNKFFEVLEDNLFNKDTYYREDDSQYMEEEDNIVLPLSNDFCDPSIVTVEEMKTLHEKYLQNKIKKRNKNIPKKLIAEWKHKIFKRRSDLILRIIKKTSSSDYYDNIPNKRKRLTPQKKSNEKSQLSRIQETTAAKVREFNTRQSKIYQTLQDSNELMTKTLPLKVMHRKKLNRQGRVSTVRKSHKNMGKTFNQFYDIGKTMIDNRNSVRSYSIFQKLIHYPDLSKKKRRSNSYRMFTEASDKQYSEKISDKKNHLSRTIITKPATQSLHFKQQLKWSNKNQELLSLIDRESNFTQKLKQTHHKIHSQQNNEYKQIFGELYTNQGEIKWEETLGRLKDTIKDKFSFDRRYIPRKGVRQFM